MDIDQLIATLKIQLSQIFKDNYAAFSNDIENDIESFLKASKDKLEKWALLLTDGAIDKDEFEWLIYSQQDLIVLQTLQSAGVSKIKLN